MEIEDPRFKIAAARRILANNGCESQVAGHVSMRANRDDAFWISPFEYFDQTLPDRLVKLDLDLRILEGEWDASSAVAFHAAFYRARPDVNSVIHTHSPFASLFATTRRTIGMYNEVSQILYQDQALYEDDGELPSVDPGRMVEALGNKSVLLMKNHGVVVVSDSLENATIESIVVEMAAWYHLEAEKIGGTEFPDAKAVTGKASWQKHFLPQMWEANLRRLRRSDPDLWKWLEE